MAELYIKDTCIEVKSKSLEEGLTSILAYLNHITNDLDDIKGILKLQTTTTLTLEDPDKTGVTLFSEFENRVGCGKSTDHLEPLSKPETGTEDEPESPAEEETKDIEEQAPAEEETKNIEDVDARITAALSSGSVDADTIVELSKELVGLKKPEIRSQLRGVLKDFGIAKVSAANTLTDKERLTMYVILLGILKKEAN